MSTGLQATGQAIAASRNRAVVPVVVAGLRSTDAEVRAAVIRAAFRRHDAATHSQILRHFADLSYDEQAIVSESHGAMPHRAAPALRKVILSGDTVLCPAACAIVARSNDYELLPALLTAAENQKHNCPSDVLAAIDRLTGGLFDAMSQWAAGLRTGLRDPSFARHQVLSALEQSLGRFAQHRRREILEAFLLLAPIDNPTFLRVLRDSTHACHRAMVESLTTSGDSGIMERLVELLRDTDTPTAALDIVARRGDKQFIKVLLHTIRIPTPLRVLHNMSKMREVVWLEENRQQLLELDGRAQATAVDLAMASGIRHEAKLELLALLLSDGLSEGRRASCRALAGFQGAKADALVLDSLEDPDAGVEAAALRQLRPRRLPDALKLLVGRLDASSAEVREAARSSLAEFNFGRYRSMFDLLDSEAVRTTGRLVHKIDRHAVDLLRAELASPSLAARLRAVEMAIAMDAVDDVREQLIELSCHENAAVRKEACSALGHGNSAPPAIAALETAANDPILSVIESAQRSLAALRQSHATAEAN